MSVFTVPLAHCNVTAGAIRRQVCLSIILIDLLELLSSIYRRPNAWRALIKHLVKFLAITSGSLLNQSSRI